MPVISGLNTVGIFVSDIDVAKRFYRDLLGFEEIQCDLKGCLMQSGTVTLYLEGGRKPRAQEPWEHPEVSPNFGAPEIKVTYANLKDAGCAFVQDLTEYSDHYHLFRVADPDGNILTFSTPRAVPTR
jgi:catechol 2,3-dioxygenase-like lactoylglutathione lyase family enzyme